MTYSFLKVADYFSGLDGWESLGEVSSSSFDPPSKTATLNFATSAGSASLLVSVVHKDIFRVRFNPARAADGYSGQNTRSVVMNTFGQLQDTLHAAEQFSVAMRTEGSDMVLTTADAAGTAEIRLVIGTRPFSLTAFHSYGGSETRIWQTSARGLRFAKAATGDYSVVLSLLRPSSAIYVGFGEQGGKSLVKNRHQLNFFCFDNYTYDQVYNIGPVDDREPLYHSDPFFMEFNGAAAAEGSCGMFVDNPAQVFVDIGVTDPSATMVGTRFGDFDGYVFVGRDAADIVDGFTSLVGKARLKPRYALGYHQGCYGYEDRGALEWAVAKYRQYGIPLDGLHIDVDFQDRYRTFTIDQAKFPQPQQMFAGLRASGVKCSTNITPIVSNASNDYRSYTDGLANDVFVADRRCPPADAGAQSYQVYGGGNQYFTYERNLGGSNYDSGKPYVGEVNYGGQLGTTGHYPDLGRRAVRDWWGKQYQDLFEAGLEMVWQDMTTPAIRDSRGDMKGFPFQLLVTDDFLSDQAPVATPAVKAWNLYSYNLHKATYHGLNHLPVRGGKRNFIVGRGSFTGMHRFAALWTGDNASTWDFLRINISQVLALGLCGQAIAGQDIGGFAQGEPNQGWVGPELLMRWTMAGAFLPWFRNHYVRKGCKDFQEPFQYEEWFKTYNRPVPDPDLYAMVVPVCRHYIERRYRLMQMFYDLMFENTLTGMPICRPLFVTDPGDATLYGDNVAYLDSQFCVGRDVLVAPILDPQASGGGRRWIYLPRGSDWYCYMDDRLPLDNPVAGGCTFTYDAALGTRGEHIAFLLPTYVRTGAVIPTLDVEQYVGERNARGLPHPITYSIYPGESGRTTTYLDDGVSRSSAPRKSADQGGDPLADDRYRSVEVSHQWIDAKTRHITVVRSHDGYTPQFETHFYLSVLQAPTGRTQRLLKVALNGAEVPACAGPAKEDIPDDTGWFHAARNNAAVIKVPDDSAAITVALTYA